MVTMVIGQPIAIVPYITQVSRGMVVIVHCVILASAVLCVTPHWSQCWTLLYWPGGHCTALHQQRFVEPRREEGLRPVELPAAKSRNAPTLLEHIIN